jgi:hypothetical protein
VHDEIHEATILQMARWDTIGWVHIMAGHPACPSWRAKDINDAATAGEFDAHVAIHGGRSDLRATSRCR